MSGDSNLLFSFEYICAVVGLDPSYVRRLLNTWRDRTIASTREAQVATGESSGLAAHTAPAHAKECVSRTRLAGNRE